MTVNRRKIPRRAGRLQACIYKITLPAFAIRLGRG